MAEPPDPPDSGPPPSRRPWLLGLSGVGLFLAGVVLGGIVALSVVLYRAPEESPRPALAPATSPPAGSPTAAAPTPSPSPTPKASPTMTEIPVGPAVGQEAPDFTLVSLDGLTYTLSAYRGQPVLVNFWAAWCPPCRQEWPELCAFAQQVTSTDVVILAINVEEPADVIRAFIGETPPPFPVLLDGNGRVSTRYRVTGLPTTFLLDAEGIVRQVVPGNLDVAALSRLIGR